MIVATATTSPGPTRFTRSSYHARALRERMCLRSCNRTSWPTTSTLVKKNTQANCVSTGYKYHAKGCEGHFALSSARCANATCFSGSKCLRQCGCLQHQDHFKRRRYNTVHRSHPGTCSCGLTSAWLVICLRSVKTTYLYQVPPEHAPPLLRFKHHPVCWFGYWPVLHMSYMQHFTLVGSLIVPLLARTIASRVAGFTNLSYNHHPSTIRCRWHRYWSSGTSQTLPAIA